ncbi:17094_t:CDS:2, partial [Gigaspora rosea]
HTEFDCVLKESVELRGTYSNEEKVAWVKGYKLGEMTIEQQDRMKLILLRYNDKQEYAKLLQYLPNLELPEDMTKEQVRKLKSQARHYLVREEVLYRRNHQNPDQPLQVIEREQMMLVLQAMHEDPVSGHLGTNITIEKLNTDEELEVKGRRVVFKSQGQVLEKTVEKRDKRNKAQQIRENMPLYLQDLDQGSNVEPIMPIEINGDLMSERWWNEEARGKLCQRLTSSKGGLVWRIAKRVYLLFSTRGAWYMQQVRQISITILERMREPDFSEVLL